MAATDMPLLQVLVVDGDLGDVALMENTFTDHSIRSELHHVADGAQALASCAARTRTVTRPDRT